MSANQSRQGKALGPHPGSSTKPRIDNTLAYQGRRLDKDSLRLIEIQPAAHESDPVVGRLTEVTFGSRPKFEALSYTWGTEKANDAIILNGFPFEVGKNLLDALLFLRRQATSKNACQLFWIDAICINQSDVKEKSRQLMIMIQIYFRAGTVVVWLGSKYAQFQKDMMSELKPNKREKPGGVLRKGGNSIQQEMVRQLRTDPYWDRLWILQEIGRATKLRVCLGNESYSWEDFMSLIAMYNSDRTTGPLKLDKLLRQEKYAGSCTLKRLIEDHREAKCSEPRDKVYGLVKLALDAGEFPIDYSKSLNEVWKDTMEFMKRWNLFEEESQILPFGALLKNLLMANHNDPPSQLLYKHEGQVGSTQLIDNPESPLNFRLQAAPLGGIVRVGPSPNDAVPRSGEAAGRHVATQRQMPRQVIRQISTRPAPTILR
ncbi:hypothetical protein THARTR1_08738 [Trichoderma harzianum]|uniref:Heterokaryon incompatibility domain-containing protein n=1 Tax=Trichoderma harzianum TaxID=5544 RepID=A0A2K0TYC3_TRIHA|nr:hypothetical protein THARTR1_08738 [Trichoderma harzianum]